MIGRKSRNEGFTLIEVTVALLVLAAAVVPLLNAAAASRAHLATARQELRALGLAQEKMEELYAARYGDLGPVTRPENIPGVPGFSYTVAVTEWSGTKTVTVTVFYPSPGGTRSVALTREMAAR